MGGRKQAAAVTAAETPVRPAVTERGEFTLDLGGESFVLRPTYEAIEAIEAGTGKGMLDLTRAALTGRITLGETAIVATECIRAFGRETGQKSAQGAMAPKVGRLILDGPGVQKVLETIAALLSLASTGGYDSSGKLKPVTTTLTQSGTGDD